MKSLKTVDAAEFDYDSYGDVLYVTFSEAKTISGKQTPRGFILRYSWPDGALVGVTIIGFCQKYANASELEIDADPPFVIALDGFECGLAQAQA